MQNNYVWIGVRESDIADTNELFSKSITIHGSGKNGNISMEQIFRKRFNHNDDDFPEYNAFFTKTMYEIIKADPNVAFIQYDNFDCISFDNELKKRIVFRNDDDLLENINNKIALKKWAEEYVNVLPYKLLSGNQLTQSVLCSAFPNSEKLVVQKSFSCGGEGTFLLSINQDQFELPISNEEQVIVTEFQENNVPINLHAVIYPEEVVMFPPSVQLISYEHKHLEYIGSDFSAYKYLSAKEKHLVTEAGLQICQALRQSGYLGICGIDLILTNDCCYFMEVNGRFQASSALLNQNLSKNGLPSLQEYHIDAFKNKKNTLPKPLNSAEGSMLVFCQSEQFYKSKWLYNRLKHSTDFTVCDDSLNWANPIENGSYLFQLHSNNSISCITFQHTTRLHPNTIISPFQLDNTDSFSNLIKLKILLLTRGVSITSKVWNAMQKGSGVDWEEFGAITLKIFNRIWITSPCLEPWYTISPLEIDYDSKNQKFILCYYGTPLFPVQIMESDSISLNKTKKGHCIKDIVYLNPDRLRIYHRNGCALQDQGLGCKFCDLYGTTEPFDVSDICEAISYYWKNERVDHFLIGGGSELSGDQCQSILDISKFIHSNTSKRIYLMSQPINDVEYLTKLKENGITEVAFNVEIFNRELAKKLMPGKSKNTLKYYCDSLSCAVKIWGATGNVRSAVLLGFDDINEFQKGIHSLCALGVSPILSVFRPCPDTPMENFMPPDEIEVMNYYEKADTICRSYGMHLGPSCQACQNNTVALDM